MTIKIGINGLGRIGRMVIRSLIESKNKNIEIKHINNRSNPETAALLLKRDSVHGQLIADLDFGDNYIKINKYWFFHKITLYISWVENEKMENK